MFAGRFVGSSAGSTMRGSAHVRNTVNGRSEKPAARIRSSSVSAQSVMASLRATWAARYRATNFSFIANVVDDPGGLFVPANSPLRTLADLVAAARARPGAITYGTTGVGSDDHLLVIGLEEVARIQAPMNHVPFNGMAPLSTQLVGGHLDVGAFNMSEGQVLYRDGKIRKHMIGFNARISPPQLRSAIEEAVAIAE